MKTIITGLTAAVGAMTLIGLSPSAQAQTGAGQAGANQAAANPNAAEGLEQVIVRTGRLEEDLPLDLDRYGVRVDVVTADTIQKEGFLDVAQTLQAVIPGLYISPKNGPFDYADISLLGGRTQDLLWLVDGVRINNRLYGSTPPVDTLPASMVERIEVLEGPEALFYGTQAVSGAINVITKDFSETPRGSFALGGDTHDGVHADGNFRDTVAGNHFVVFASVDESSGTQAFRDQDYQPSTTDRDRGYNLRTFGAKYAIDPSETVRFSASYQHTEGRLDDAIPEFARVAYNQRNEDILSAKVDYTQSDKVQFYAKGYLHWWRSHYTEYDNDLDVPGSVDTVDDHDFWGYKDYGATAGVKLSLNRGFDYYLGADYQSYSGNDAVLVITRKSENVHAFYAEVATNSDLLANASFAAGFRYDDASVGPAATVWDVSAKYDLPGGFFVRGLVGTAFRLPSAEELFADDPEDERGNPNLKPEKSTNVNVSFGGPLGNARLSWELVGFYRNIKDLITFDGFDDATDQSLAENVAGEVHVRGGELLLNAAISADLSATASYTYSRARQQGDLQISKVPEQLAKLSLDYHPVEQRFGATLDLDHVGKVYQSVWDGREQYGNYVVLNLSGRMYLDDARHHVVTARLANAFDKEYASSIGSAESDSDGSNYTYWNLGLRRTFELRYTCQF